MRDVSGKRIDFISERKKEREREREREEMTQDISDLPKVTFLHAYQLTLQFCNLTN